MSFMIVTPSIINLCILIDVCWYDSSDTLMLSSPTPNILPTDIAASALYTLCLPTDGSLILSYALFTEIVNSSLPS